MIYVPNEIGMESTVQALKAAGVREIRDGNGNKMGEKSSVVG